MAEPSAFELLPHLVTEKIASFLPLEDLKSLTLVSGKVKDAVRRTTQFSNRVRLHVTKAAIENGLVVDGMFSPKHVFLELFNSLNVEDDLLGEILNAAVSLVLSFPPTPMTFNGTDFDFGHYSHQALKMGDNLKSLHMNQGFLYRVSPCLFGKLEIKEMLCRLDAFSITAYREGTPHIFSGVMHESFQQSLIAISKMPLNLKIFRFGNVAEVNNGFLQRSYLLCIPQLVQRARETLQELELLDTRVWGMEEMSNITCPKLRRVSISALGNEESIVTVEHFLQNHPRLKALDMVWTDVLPETMMEIILGSSSMLKSLSLKVKSYMGGPQNIHWRKLGEMSELEEFSLIMSDVAEGIPLGMQIRVQSILRWLPRSVGKITLQGFKSPWREDFILGWLDITILASHFGKLTQLNLDQSHGAVGNVGLQIIIRRYPKLTHLYFSHCNGVTDYGVTGVQDDLHGRNSGASLDMLKGLTHFGIRSCPNISPVPLINVISKCRFLQSFNYFSNDPVPKELLILAAHQNPCLESLGMNIAGFENAAPITGDMTALIEEVNVTNPRIHHLAVQERLWFHKVPS